MSKLKKWVIGELLLSPLPLSRPSLILFCCPTVLIISSAALCITCCSSMIALSYPDTRAELGMSQEVATLGLSLYVLGMGFFPREWSNIDSEKKKVDLEQPLTSLLLTR
jgi:hypothetical protein